ncbi:MAG: alpha/beta hydrolase [Anaerolineaceae bacterium]|nr:MAG: alpha/beta hydrolase [Anaerolineaceae bacterium]
MKEYQQELIRKLDNGTGYLDIDGLRIEIKKVPDGSGSGKLDPRVLMEQESFFKKGVERGNEPSIEELRDNMGGFNYNLNTVEIYTKYLEVETNSSKVPVWAYFPRSSQRDRNRKALLYVHGGAFFGGTVFAVENNCRLIAERADCIVFNIDYSLAPENPYPIPCNQVYEALKYIYTHSEELGVDKRKIAMSGDSAGGNLTAVCAQMDRDKKTNYLKLEILLYPKLTFTNHELPGYWRNIDAFYLVEEQKKYLERIIHIGSDESNEGDARVYVQGREDIKHPYISPTFGVKQELCKTVIILAEYDGLRLEGEFYGKQLKEAKVPVRIIRYEGMTHGFFDKLGIFPQAESVVNEIACELKRL